MHYLLAVLLSLLSLFRVCSSTLNETLSDGEYLEKHLVRRAASATTLFAFLDPGQKGSCTSDQQTKISAWIADATELHNAITSAVNVGIGKQDAVHLRVFLGIAVTPDGPQPGPDKANWDDVKEHIEIVGQFLNGNGIRGATAGTKPYFFCDDSFATYAPWDQIAKDASGQDIPDRVNGGFITVQTLFSNIKGTTQRNIPVLPFWADKFNAYIFSGVSQQRLCDGTIFAHTPRARDSTYANNHVDVEAGTFGRFIYFCDKGWNSRPGTTATVASLADIVTYEGYPTAGSDEQEIVDLMPISATFYHELYHLTDQTDLPTDDNYMSLPSVLLAANAKKSDISLNPESYNYFAVASYLARNVPTPNNNSPAKVGVVFFGGLPVAAI